MHDHPPSLLLRGIGLSNSGSPRIRGRQHWPARRVERRVENADVTGAHVFDAEFHPLRGELLLARDPGAASQAKGAFQRARVVAESQSEVMRAACDGEPRRLWRDHGKHEEAGRLPRGIHDWFPEGLDTQDLRDAKTLLDELA